MLLLHRLATLILLCALTGSLLGQLGRLFWVFDLFNPFQLHALMAGLLLIPALYRWHDRTGLKLSLLLLASAGLAVAPALTLTGARATMPAGTGLTVLSYNVLSANPDQASVVRLLRTEQADVAVLVEGNHRWQAAMDGLQDLYPYQQMLDDAGNFGIILLSRHPFQPVLTRAPLLPDGGKAFALLVADLQLENGQVRLAALHTSPPLTDQRKTARDEAIRALADLTHQSPVPVVIAGDFNATPWTPTYRQTVQTAGLTGTSWQPSWPAPLYAAGLAIDQVLAGRGAVVTRVRTGPLQQSDHRARMAEITLPASSLP